MRPLRILISICSISFSRLVVPNGFHGRCTNSSGNSQPISFIAPIAFATNGAEVLPPYNTTHNADVEVEVGNHVSSGSSDNDILYWVDR